MRCAPTEDASFVVPADVSGRFTRRRYLGFVVLLLVYVAHALDSRWAGIRRCSWTSSIAPSTCSGPPSTRRTAWLAFFLLSGVGFLLLVVTALWGRVWCGYACPQTVFLEGVYPAHRACSSRGRATSRLKREQAGVSARARLAQGAEARGVPAALRSLVAHVFLSYFVSLPALFAMMRARPAEHPEAFAWAARHDWRHVLQLRLVP